MKVNSDKKIFRLIPGESKYVNLGEICEVIAGQSPPSDTYRSREEGLPFFQGKADFSSMHPIPRVWCVTPIKVAEKNDILISVRAPIGPTNLADRECCIGRGLAAIRCGKSVDYEYLLYWFKKEEPQIEKLGSGSTFSAITGPELKSLFVPLPPLDEQKRIAAILNERMAAIDTARAAAEAQIEAANALTAAFLRQVFPKDKEPLSPGWRRLRLGDVVEINARQVNPRNPVYSELPHVSAEDIESGTGRLFTLQTAAEDKMISGKYLFDCGAVLYSKIRPYLRKAAIAKSRGICSADMYPLEVIEEQLIPEYLLWLLLADSFTAYAEAESRRARMPKLNRDQLFNYKAPLPSLEQQRKIATSLSKQMESNDLLQRKLVKQLDEINALPHALLRQAFNGEL